MQRLTQADTYNYEGHETDTDWQTDGQNKHQVDKIKETEQKVQRKCINEGQKHTVNTNT